MFYDKTWTNFVNYVSTFEPYVADKDQLIGYFVNPAGKAPGFKSRSLGWYNPISSRKHSIVVIACVSMFICPVITVAGIAM
jgi:hypothetical protein